MQGAIPQLGVVPAPKGDPGDNRAMADNFAPLTDAEMAELEQLLDRIPEPFEPLDLMMLDGYLVGVLLQPQQVPLEQWLRHVTDADGRPMPPKVEVGRLEVLVRRRHTELNRAIHGRQWFDPWVFELDDDADPLETVMPWVAGFATAMTFFPQLMRNDSAAVLEPLAVLYRVFDPEDLEDADELLEMIEMIEPPDDLDAAVEGLVTSTLLLADVSRPQQGGKSPAPARPRAAPRRPGAARERAEARGAVPAKRTPGGGGGHGGGSGRSGGGGGGGGGQRGSGGSRH